MQSRHSAERLAERGYTPEQVYETARDGDEYPNRSQPGTSIFKYDSTGHPGTRRRVVASVDPPTLITVLPREPKEQPVDKPKQAPKSTKKNKREQLAKKRARSRGEQS